MYIIDEYTLFFILYNLKKYTLLEFYFIKKLIKYI